MFYKIKEDPLVLFYYLIGMIYLFFKSLNKNFKVGYGPKIIGIPLIDQRKNSKIFIGKNVTIRSRNKGYHINLVARSKLFTDPGGSIEIGDNTRIYGSCIHASKSIKIGKNCLIAGNVNIIDRNGHDFSIDNPKNRINTYGKVNEIIIEDNVWIGANVIVLPGTKISEGSVIMANSVVKGEYNSKCLIGGVPARILKEYK